MNKKNIKFALSFCLLIILVFSLGFLSDDYLEELEEQQREAKSKDEGYVGVWHSLTRFTNFESVAYPKNYPQTHIALIEFYWLDATKQYATGQEYDNQSRDSFRNITELMEPGKFYGFPGAYHCFYAFGDSMIWQLVLFRWNTTTVKWNPVVEVNFEYFS